MASPMNCPAALTATYCLALPVPKLANELTPKPLSSRSASGPLRNRSVMWCDWSNSTHEVRQACCSVRQLVNSGATGKACGRAVDCRSSSTGEPARRIAASRLIAPMSSATSTAGSGVDVIHGSAKSAAAPRLVHRARRAPRIGQADSLDRDKCLARGNPVLDMRGHREQSWQV